MGKRVIILGGGVAGMTAAHELAALHFEVEVFEYRAIPGGKARSMHVPSPKTKTRPRLPAEHGFRFFPGFYKYLPKTLGEIPCNRPGCPAEHVVADHLVGTTAMQVARTNDHPALFDFDTPGPRITSSFTALKFIFEYQRKLRIPPNLFGFFVYKILELMARKEEWFTKFEEQGWYEYSGAAGQWKDNATYQKYLATGVTRTMVAARADGISARTAGCTMVKLIETLSRADGRADRVLNGPTNDVWIDPWLRHLRDQGVTYRLNHEVTKIHLEDGAVEKITVKGPHGEEEVKGDYYIAALPAEVMKCLVTPAMCAADSCFEKLGKLETSWMNGVMVYLREPLDRQVHGHAIYIDSPWALTSICQQQFWEPRLAGMGDGQVRDILSVDVSDWDGESNGKVAKHSTRRQIEREVIAQLRAHLDHDPRQALHDDNIRTCFVDPDITFQNPRTDPRAANAEPLLLNKPKSWQNRPTTKTKIPNLFLASDYVRTDTDLATMEGANEAARVAVNEICEQTGDAPEPMFPAWSPPLMGEVFGLLSFIRGKRPFRSRAGILPVGPDFEELLSENPGARAADHLLIDVGTPEAAAPEDAWMLDERELDAFSDALVESPEETLDALEHELSHPRSELKDALELP